MTNIGWIVVGAIAIAFIFVFHQELKNLLNRVIRFKLKVGVGEFELQTTSTPLGETTVSNASKSVAPHEPVGTHVTYLDPTYGFLLRWPAGGEWIQSESMAATIGASLVIAYYQTFGNFTPNVNVTVEEVVSTSLDRWLKLGDQALKQLGYTIIETSRDPVTNSGVRVLRMEDVAGTLYQIQRVILSRSRAFVATGSKLETDHAAFPELYEQMREILNSFQVIE